MKVAVLAPISWPAINVAIMPQGAMIPPSLLEDTARRFRLLGEPVRLALLNVLHNEGELAVQDLCARTDQSQANVSKHLRLLLDEGLVRRRQDGVFAYYTIADPTIAALCLLVCGQLQRADAV